MMIWNVRPTNINTVSILDCKLREHTIISLRLHLIFLLPGTSTLHPSEITMIFRCQQMSSAVNSGPRCPRPNYQIPLMRALYALLHVNRSMDKKYIVLPCNIWKSYCQIVVNDNSGFFMLHWIPIVLLYIISGWST